MIDFSLELPHRRLETTTFWRLMRDRAAVFRMGGNYLVDELSRNLGNLGPSRVWASIVW